MYARLSFLTSPIPNIPVLITVTIASRVSLIISDCLLIVVTWFGVNRPARIHFQKNTFAAVLLRDGERFIDIVSTSRLLTSTQTDIGVGAVYFV